uniref:Uncharacterized protein n=1 Tax=Romanomermis culicivorax TaxID=13658 RepID=A0A915JET5_ROMCU
MHAEMGNELTLPAEDSPQRISISVIDIDEKPKFINQPVPFLAVVQPDVPVGLTVYHFFARDEDGDGDSDVDFKLISTERRANPASLVNLEG